MHRYLYIIEDNEGKQVFFSDRFEPDNDFDPTAHRKMTVIDFGRWEWTDDGIQWNPVLQDHL